ncbi:MAG: KOW domain-containing RNA-binding protein [Clostridia bacterium]|nr:KOW domain-containing RNA-binding protein [Clostridia bacterium]MDE7191987.1 KOW domain-containing RNA-binding protein [Clostridia bacterium]MDE7348175.1 KOW domain-containing RNA-binding protein [Clostridia bacterium]
MAFKVGDIVQSKSGHDAKKYFVVIATLNESYVLIADGKSRKLDSPKQKNVKHVKLIEEASDINSYVDDKSIADRLGKLDTVE